MDDKTKLQAATVVVAAVAEAIRDLKQVPSGHLYAQLMSLMSLEQYEQVIDLLIKHKMVRREPSHLLVWIGTPAPVPASTSPAQQESR